MHKKKRFTTVNHRAALIIFLAGMLLPFCAMGGAITGPCDMG